MRYTVVSMMLLSTLISPVYAEDMSDPKAENPYFLKYGQAGFDQYHHFQQIMDQRIQPDRTTTTHYAAQKPAIALDYFKPVATTMARPDNAVCINNTNADEITLDRKTVIETYTIGADTIRIENDVCSGALYNVKDKTLRAAYDGDGASYMHIYVNNQKRFDIANVSDYGLHGSDLVARIAESCCSMSSHYNHYNWQTGETLAHDALELSIDDLPLPDSPPAHTSLKGSHHD